MKEMISVIVPVYNVEIYLERCIQSLVSQTYLNLEIVLVDDGSTDSSSKICDKWAENDTRIKVIHKENGGLSDARNAGLKVAMGEYISFVDSDDWIAKDFYEVLIRVLNENNADIAECGVYFVNDKEEILQKRGIKEEVLTLNRIEALKRLILENGVYQTVWNKLYKRTIVQGILFEVGKYHEDEYWTYQVFDRIEKMAVINQPGYYYLQRNSSIMGEKYSIKRLDGLEARAERVQFLKKYPELKVLARQQLWFSILFHFQNVICYLKGNEKRIGMKKIKTIMRELPLTSEVGTTLNKKYKCWFALFSRMPYLTAKIRNVFRIGL